MNEQDTSTFLSAMSQLGYALQPRTIRRLSKIQEPQDLAPGKGLSAAPSSASLSVASQSDREGPLNQRGLTVLTRLSALLGAGAAAEAGSGRRRNGAGPPRTPTGDIDSLLAGMSPELPLMSPGELVAVLHALARLQHRPHRK